MRQRGGTVSVNKDGYFIGTNKSGEADAELLNLIGIRWYPKEQNSNEKPKLTEFYERHGSRVAGFNMSFSDAIYTLETPEEFYSLFPSQEDFSLYVLNLIKEIGDIREREGERHQSKNILSANRTNEKGHAHMYGLIRNIYDKYYCYLKPNSGCAKSTKSILGKSDSETINFYKQEYENFSYKDGEKLVKEVTPNRIVRALESMPRDPAVKTSVDEADYHHTADFSRLSLPEGDGIVTPPETPRPLVGGLRKRRKNTRKKLKKKRKLTRKRK